MWEIGEEETEGGDAVVEEGDPGAPAPGVAGGEELRVHYVGGEGGLRRL